MYTVKFQQDGVCNDAASVHSVRIMDGILYLDDHEIQITDRLTLELDDTLYCTHCEKCENCEMCTECDLRCNKAETCDERAY
ncbi:hypothetical protein KAR91_14905 [Candidatus Pacearchaeota archaeon]|nr:hypothetical protein [Candidatus Pacearchaeota archaeon]